MRYQIAMSTGDKFFITEEEAMNIGKGEAKGSVFVPSLKGFINLSHHVYVLPEDKLDRSKQTSGRLHDGTKVIKSYGHWVDALNPDVKLSIEYYPEIIKDKVMSEEEYQEKQNLKLLN